jgi:hypothetical protein
MLTETATIHRNTPGVEDDYGNATDAWAQVATVKARFEQRAAQEVTRDRDTLISDWVVFFLPDTVVYGRDRVGDVYGRTFEVVGAPAMRRAPDRDVFVEASLRHIDGG